MTVQVSIVMLSVVFQATALLMVLSCGAYGQRLTEEDMAEILNAHNYYRRTVDPISTNMLIMVPHSSPPFYISPVTLLLFHLITQEWDEELAYMAQFTASTCRYVENEDRHSQSSKFDYVGENFAATVSYTVNYTQIIGQLWYGEKRYFNYYTATCYDQDGNANDDGGYENCGRYTQV